MEESGALKVMRPWLNGSNGDFEALHPSCHGDITAPMGKTGRLAWIDVMPVDTEVGLF